MTETQIKNKVKDLEFWLNANPNHYEYAKKNSQKKELERKLATKDYDKARN